MTDILCPECFIGYVNISGVCCHCLEQFIIVDKNTVKYKNNGTLL